MRTLDGDYLDDIEVEERAKLRGRFHADIWIRSSRLVEISGECLADVWILAGSRVDISGSVAGTVYLQGGAVRINGVVGEVINDQERGTVELGPNGLVLV